ncbi:PREDICTED: uncharacterized protein LOC105555806, partial [Vollenhovia emeryi]|uniref:uncharacterized protein LOC105555806 n=1 Tax=Vollenhovia emeryi TaxID=411798 RepID=UPI0005F50766
CERGKARATGTTTGRRGNHGTLQPVELSNSTRNPYIHEYTLNVDKSKARLNAVRSKSQPDVDKSRRRNAVERGHLAKLRLETRSDRYNEAVCLQPYHDDRLARGGGGRVPATTPRRSANERRDPAHLKRQGITYQRATRHTAAILDNADGGKSQQSLLEKDEAPYNSHIGQSESGHLYVRLKAVNAPEYRQRRGTLKAQLTRFTTYLDRFTENRDEQQLIERATDMKFVRQEFNTIQDAIDLLNEERACAKLGINKKRIENPIAVSGFNVNITQLKEAVNATISSIDRRFTTRLNFLIVSVITDDLPSRFIKHQTLKLPEHIELADPEFYKPSKIDALIGAELFYELLCVGQIRLNSNKGILLQKTRLGWLITGKIECSGVTTKQSLCHIARDLEQQVERFWEMEQVSGKTHMSSEERECELHFIQNTTRDDSGRYIVRLPFNDKLSELGNNKQNAMRRLVSLERRLMQNEDMNTGYGNFLDEYNTLGHMQETSELLADTDGYFIPHHAVFKETSQTTKLRVVFDASAKSDTGVSLNDTLKVGPTVQQDLFSIITRFRTYTFAMTADLEKMYRQVRVHPADCNHQRILWRVNSTSPIKIFELRTLTYGTAAAAFLATRCLKQLALDEGEKFPLAKRALLQDFYVDDVLTGAFDLNQALALRDQLIQITRQGGFNPRQWRSNAAELLEGLTDNEQGTYNCLSNVGALKTLGVYWNPIGDLLLFRITTDPKGKENTKRRILSRIATLFDPLGLLGPVIVKAKIILQSLWKYKLGWDEAVPQEIATSWNKYNSNLGLLNDYSIPRRILGSVSGEIQLHCFCHASESAFGACMYLRTSKESETMVRLICSKTRVAPMKQTSLPRLELCAAQLLAKLYDVNINAMNIQFSRVYFWSDSTITLNWIKTSPHRLKTFVANRVSEIQGITQGHEWRHVPSADNPADALSRGQFPNEFIENRIWREGPDWLQKNEEEWPENIIPGIDVPEQKTRVFLLSWTNALEQNIIGIINNFSSLGKISRIMAYALRYVAYLRNKKLIKGDINSDEMRAALHYVIRIVQSVSFPTEISCLKTNRPIDRKSKLLPLSPFLDDTLLRVGGRLKHSELEYDNKYPILLPCNNHLSKLLIVETHAKLAHAGAQTTLYALRQEYWILNGKMYVKKLLRKCVPCFRVKPKIPNHLMGNLPRDRLQCSRPFENIGVDFCGPFFVKERKFRNRNKIKIYVSVFICLVTKAIHLEVVSDLTTEAFLAALKRFFSRRGKAKIIYSDNATNFVGANNKLTELHQCVERNLSQLQSQLTNEGITWKFIPPKSPHFGGIWESAVKSFKHHLHRVVGESLFTFEEFNTFIIEVEAILNSRPLTAMSIDPNDLIALSPAHFLIGTSLTTVPEHDFVDVPINRLSNWEHIQRVKQHFWERWSKEYLNELQQKYKWFIKDETNVKIGSLVMLKEDNMPPMRWIIGRIVALHPGDDNIVRVVTVKTNSGLYKRSIRKLALLPID